MIIIMMGRMMTVMMRMMRIYAFFTIQLLNAAVSCGFPTLSCSTEPDDHDDHDDNDNDDNDNDDCNDSDDYGDTDDDDDYDDYFPVFPFITT